MKPEKYFVLILTCSFLLFSCSFPVKPTEPPEAPFVSDGCSCWPDWDYYECCYEHDKVYWWGGTAEERKEADLRLIECVAEKEHRVMPYFMYIGVRIGGHGWLPTPFRWGFGRPWPEGYYSNDEIGEEEDHE